MSSKCVCRLASLSCTSVITMRRSFPGQLLPLCMGRRMKSHGGHLSLTCKEEARPDHEDKCSLDHLNLSQPTDVLVGKINDCCQWVLGGLVTQH